MEYQMKVRFILQFTQLRKRNLAIQRIINSLVLIHDSGTTPIPQAVPAIKQLSDRKVMYPRASTSHTLK